MYCSKIKMTHPTRHPLQWRSELYLGRVPDTLPTRTDWFFCPCLHHKYRGKGPGSVPLVWLLQQRKEVPVGSQIWNLQRFYFRIKCIVISYRQIYKILKISYRSCGWTSRSQNFQMTASTWFLSFSADFSIST